jgi:hypothetical protein
MFSMGSAISSSLTSKIKGKHFNKNNRQTTRSANARKPHVRILIDIVERALNIESASEQRGAALSLPLLAESKQMGAHFMNSLNVGGRVALDAVVLVPQHVQQRLLLPVD